MTIKTTAVAAALALAFSASAFAQTAPGKRTDSAPSTGTTSESMAPRNAEERTKCGTLTGAAKEACVRDLRAQSGQPGMGGPAGTSSGADSTGTGALGGAAPGAAGTGRSSGTGSTTRTPN